MAKILFIEDEVRDELGPVNILKQHHHIAKSATTFNEAISAMLTERFDLILLDIKLAQDGERAGFTILNRKRKIPMNAKTPVIIITGQVTEEIVKRKTDERDRIFAVLEKPITLDRVLDQITRVLGRTE